MKKLFVLLCTIAFMATACNREEPEPNPTPDNGSQNESWIPNAVTDYDGNSYNAVRIGDQVWMASNLRTTHYANGDSIPAGGTNRSLTKPYYYFPNNDESLVATFGCLYNWPAVMHGSPSSENNPSGVQGICPKGWHLPSNAEWDQLIHNCKKDSTFVCNASTGGIANALAANHDWEPSDKECSPGYDLSSNNATSFGAVPAGIFYGGYMCLGTLAKFWGATGCDGCTYAYQRYIFNDGIIMGRVTGDKDGGLSIRCIRD